MPEAAARRHTAHQPLRGVLWGLNATRGLRASLPLELAIADVGVPRIEHPAEDARVEEVGARRLPAIDGEASSMRGMSHARVSPVNKKKAYVAPRKTCFLRNLDSRTSLAATSLLANAEVKGEM